MGIEVATVVVCTESHVVDLGDAGTWTVRRGEQLPADHPVALANPAWFVDPEHAAA